MKVFVEFLTIADYVSFFIFHGARGHFVGCGAATAHPFAVVVGDGHRVVGVTALRHPAGEQSGNGRATAGIAVGHDQPLGVMRADGVSGGARHADVVPGMALQHFRVEEIGCFERTLFFDLRCLCRIWGNEWLVDEVEAEPFAGTPL